MIDVQLLEKMKTQGGAIVGDIAFERFAQAAHAMLFVTYDYEHDEYTMAVEIAESVEKAEGEFTHTVCVSREISDLAYNYDAALKGMYEASKCYGEGLAAARRSSISALHRNLLKAGT